MYRRWKQYVKNDNKFNALRPAEQIETRECPGALMVLFEDQKYDSDYTIFS
jgi:hypothetical protein